VADGTACVGRIFATSGGLARQGRVVPGKLMFAHLVKKFCQSCTRSVRKVSDRIFLCEHLMDYNLARLHEPTLNLSAHA